MVDFVENFSVISTEVLLIRFEGQAPECLCLSEQVAQAVGEVHPELAQGDGDNWQSGFCCSHC